MDWWQIFLIILFSVVIGIGVGYIVGYLIITRILKKPFAFLGKAREVVIVTEEPPKPITTPGLFSRFTRIREKIGLRADEPVMITSRDATEVKEIEEQEREEAIVTKEAPEPVIPDVLAELTEEKERKKAEQQAKEQLKREVEEARKARLIQERERKKAEQEARELAKREAEEAKKAREAEEQERKRAEQQARELARIEAEKSRREREIEELERKKAEREAEVKARGEAEEEEEISVIEEPEREKAAVGEEQLLVAASNLFAEVENNRIIANEPWTGKLVPFQTNVWNANPAELHALPANLREQLAQAYSDIQLANSIVWLATELERRSPNLDENYTKLCTNIASRLESIIPLLQQLEKK